MLLGGAWHGLGLGIGRAAPAGPGSGRGPGSPTGRSGGGPGRGPVRRLLLVGLPWAVVLLASAPLASRDGYAYACQGALVTHGVNPYTSGVATLPCRWLDSVPSLWWHTSTPYGPLWLLLSGGAAVGSGGHLAGAIALLRLVAVGGVALTAWAGHRLAGTLGANPATAVWLGALSPLVLVHAVSGVHNDALLAGLVVAAFAVAARRIGRPGAVDPVDPAGGTDRGGPDVAGGAAGSGRMGGRGEGWPAWTGRVALAGALLGLAVAVKATALVALPFVVLLAAGDGHWRRLVRAGAAAGLGLVAGYAVLAVPSGYGLGWLGALSGTTQLIQWTSPPTGLGMTAGYLARGLGRRDLATPALDAARWAGLLVLAVTLVTLWLWARRRAAQPRLVVLAAGLAMTGTVLLAPVAFPWYMLAPLAVLAASVTGDRLRYRLGLAATGLALLVLPDGTGLAALTKLPGALLDTALLVTVVVVVLRRRRAGRARPTATGC
jgi:hypothetical protein